MCVRKWIVVTTSSRCWTLWRTSVPLVQYLTCFCRQIGSDCIQLHTLVSLNLDCQVNCCSNNLVSVVLKLWLIHWSIRGRGTSTNVDILWLVWGPPPIRQAEAHAGFDSAQVFAAEVDGSEWPGGELGLFLLPFVTLCYPKISKMRMWSAKWIGHFWREPGCKPGEHHGEITNRWAQATISSKANNTRFTSNHTELLISWNKWLVKNTFTSLW